MTRIYSICFYTNSDRNMMIECKTNGQNCSRVYSGIQRVPFSIPDMSALKILTSVSIYSREDSILYSIDIDAFSGLERLQYLRLENCIIRSKSSTIELPSGLTALNIKYCNSTTIDYDSILLSVPVSIRHLVILDLDCTAVTVPSVRTDLVHLVEIALKGYTNAAMIQSLIDSAEQLSTIVLNDIEDTLL